ncbi:hypothetical protein SCUCBS95973_001979 [Sporothrix curviconia]|uniref:Prenylcysteine lyase domain-containing protein n=1 Tax=Sporothrix curviconia TaxID=1260050 RepID=A0ABP0B2X4_9PEZI
MKHSPLDKLQMKPSRRFFAGTAGLLLASAVHGHHIAVIGAGAAGSSTAYHLRQFADADGVDVNITLFEKTDHIGGRTLTAHAFGDANQPVELGASIFVQINEILWNAASNFSLPLQPAGGFDDDAALLGIWDGDRFAYTQDDRSSGWWNIVRLVWTYGTAPYRANKLMQATIRRFLELYRAPYFPFRSLTTRAYELELTFVTSQTGQQFLDANNVGTRFSHDIVQASTRVNYASNLARIHGLDAMVALAPSGASQIRGGNWQIFDRMARASGAHVRLNTSITHLDKVPGTSPPSTKYVVKTTDALGIEAEEEFDSVVLASPFQFSGIAAGDGVLQTAIDAIPYVKLHVTLFTSPLKFDAAYFNLEPGSKNVPTTVLTTLADDDDDQGSSGADGSGKAGFFSVSTLRRVINPTTLREEYLYKIFSPEAVTPAFLSELFGVDVPGTFTDETAELPVISWYYPHIFHSYPKALPRVTFQDPIVGDGLYYTSGIESFISTMETSALMGKNVARLIVDDIQGLATGGAVLMENGEEDGKKPILVGSEDKEKIIGEL